MQSDTIVPQPGNPQALNRYSYVLNNPLRYTDPSGHAQVCADGDQGGGCGDNDAWYRLTQQWYGIDDQGLLDATIVAWLQDHQDIRTIQAMAGYLETTYGQSDAILPSSFNTIYAHAFAAGELAQLATNPRAQLLAGAIFAGVGVGGANLGGLKREVAGGTYKLVDPTTGEVMRTGRTNDLNRRQSEHRRNVVTRGLDFERDWVTNDYAVQRGREQMLHEQYQPALNRIRPISPTNPKLQEYLTVAHNFGVKLGLWE